jgi:hypothetical protein
MDSNIMEGRCMAWAWANRHRRIKALELAGIEIMHQGKIDRNRHYIVVDGANLEKLDAYLKSRKPYESGMCLDAS